MPSSKGAGRARGCPRAPVVAGNAGSRSRSSGSQQGVAGVFPTAETGFDPVARLGQLFVVGDRGDLRAPADVRLSRAPAKVVPQVAEAMPEVTDDGRTCTFRLRKGIHFAPDPAFKGQKRELTAGTSSTPHAVLRSEEPLAVRVPARGQDRRPQRARAKAEEERAFDYDAKVARTARSVDRYTLRFRLSETDYNFAFIGRAHALRRRRARGDRGLPRTRWAIRWARAPYMLKRWTRRAKIVLSANPELSRLHVGLPPTDRPVGRHAPSRDEGQGDAADRAHRDQRSSRRRNRAVAFVPADASSTTSTCPPDVPPSVPRRRERAEAGAREAGGLALSRHSIPISRTPRSTSAIRSSAASARRRSRCAAR